MDFDRLRAFVWTVEEGEITAAARRLYRTQPAVTRMLQTLEEQIGVELIDRRVKPLQPTPAGERILEQARDILRVADRLFDQSVRSGTARQAIKLGISRSLVWQLRVQRFRKAAPPLDATDFFIRSGWSPRLYRRFSRGEFDSALILMPQGWTPDPRWDARLLRGEPLMIVAPGRQDGGTVKTEALELSRRRWILNPDGCGFRHALNQCVVSAGGHLQVHFELDAAPAEHLAMCAAGMGCTVVPGSAFDEHPQAAEQVHRLEVKGFDGQLNVWLLWHDASKPLPGTQDALATALA